MIKFSLNGKNQEIDVDPSTPLLWVIREELGMTGTKFGCGKGLCGACTVHLNGQATRSCILPLVGVANQEVTTIEGLSEKKNLHPVQSAWIKHNVAQCGYCQSGQIMQAASIIDNAQTLTKESLIASMSANLCRCGTYNKLKEALFESAKEKLVISE